MATLIAERRAREALEKDYREGKCRCWQDPKDAERGHHENCMEEARVLMRGYCARIRQLLSVLLEAKGHIIALNDESGNDNGECFVLETINKAISGDRVL